MMMKSLNWIGQVMEIDPIEQYGLNLQALVWDGVVKKRYQLQRDLILPLRMMVELLLMMIWLFFWLCWCR